MDQMWQRQLAMAMVSALTGNGDEASRMVESALRDASVHGADPHGDQVAAGARFAAAVQTMQEAATQGSDHAGTVEFADACVALARTVGEPGWEAGALALRVVTHPTGADDDRTLEDLIAAETALHLCTDADLAWAGHIALGLAYRSLRLFELAIIHQQDALEGPTAPFGMGTSRLLPLLHLGETHLHWADELEQLGDDRQVDAIQEHRWLAAELAREAAETGESDGADAAFVNEARVLELCASWENDPARAGEELSASLDESAPVGFTDHGSDHRVRLAQIYAAKGETDRAIACAKTALTEFATVHDPRSEARVRYVAVSLAADAGDAGSRSGLECAQVVARSWWAQRLSKLHSVQRVLINEELIRRNHRYQREAREDPLTGVGNRRALDEQLEALGRINDPVAVVVIDVDRFKAINDSFGHGRGDEALCAVANLLADHVRDRDLVARTGGDEFAVVLHAADERQTAELVDRLRLALLDFTTVTAHEHLQMIRLSYGWACTAEGIPAGSLIGTADARMYADKHRKADPVAAQPAPQT